MNILFSDRFKTRFEKLPLKIQDKFENRLGLFMKAPSHPLLKSHPLKGNLVGFRAFSVTGDYRVIYKIIENESVKLVNIGRHAQVYE